MAVAIAAFFCFSCATHPPVASASLALRKVVIYRNGVGYFERGGRVNSNRVEFKVRKDEIGDFLATLAVLERGGSSVRSAAFPLDVDDSEPRAVSPPPTPGAPAERSKLRTVVMSLDGRDHDLQVGYIAETPVWRPSYRLVIDKDGANLQAWGIVQNLSGEDWNNVSLSLVTDAPLAFDAGLGKPVIPERPEVNDAGDVIAVIPRAETSLGQDAPPLRPLPTEVAAADAPAEMESQPGSDALTSRGAASPLARKSLALGGAGAGPSGNAGPALSRRGVAPRPLTAPPAAPYSRQTRSLSALAAIAVQSGTTRYDLPAAVTIPDRSATMVMLLDRHLPGEAIAMFAPDAGVPDSAAHPFRVARYTNKTGGLLERGPLAIFSEGAFLGQGLADPLPDGATATVPFALERTLAVELNHENREEGARLAHIEAGTLTIARDAVWLTRYRLRNGGEHATKVLLKHPRVPGARLDKPPQGTEDNVGTGSALIPGVVAARASLEVVVDERQESTRLVDWLDPLADDAVQSYLADRRAEPGVATALRQAWVLRHTLVEANEQRQKMLIEQDERRRATEETRANLKALEKNAAAADLRAKLTARLSQDSAKLDVLGKRLIEINLHLNETQIRFTEALRAIKLMQPLPVASSGSGAGG